MIIQILGTGCPKCRTLEANVIQAIQEGALDATVEKVTDPDAIIEMGVMLTPALAIDGEVKSMGNVLNKEQILSLFKRANA
ncbi:MAG: thioredoxin family protein [Sphaerochaetaceae bacterium]